MVAPSTQRNVLKRLYRSLIRASRPFTPPSPNAVVLTCLLDRTGTEDALWVDFLRGKRNAGESAASIAEADDDQEDEDEYDEDFDIDIDNDSDHDDDDDPSHVMFRKLLREAVTGDQKGIRQMQFPSHVTDPYRIRNIIRREFRRRDDDDNNSNDEKTAELAVKKQVAFLGLRKLNEKLAWAQHLEQTAGAPIVQHDEHQAAARFVSPLPLRPPECYLRPGSFLIAHPNLNGYFRRTVICILDHREENEGFKVKMKDVDDDVLDPALARRMVGTYGLVVNRICVSAHSGKHLSLQETIRPLPEQLSKAFGGSLVRDGGPVQVSLQMLHCLSPDLQEEVQIGGHILPMIPSSNDEIVVESTALGSDRAVFFQGDILTAAAAVTSGQLDRKNVTFFVGASSWMPGQLESEIERGLWLPCRGPPEIAMYGTCEYYTDETEENKEPNSSRNTETAKRSKPDLWLSLLSACGEDEAKLAHLLWNDDGFHAYGSALDNFD
jgi:putative AlgH/UPF0301 family transcriptional regulator